MNAHINSTAATLNAKAAPSVTAAEAEAEHAAYVVRRKPVLDQLDMLVNDPTERVSPELLALMEAHRVAYVERDLLCEVPAGSPGHEEWEAEVARLDDLSINALVALFAYEARRNEDIACRAKYLMVIDKTSDVFSTPGAGEALLQSMANAINPHTAAMMSATYPSTSESLDPEVRMSWLMRAYRDAAMLIDPTIRGCWIGNNVNFVPEGGTTLASVFFDRGEGAGFKRKAGDAQVRQSYLTSEKLEPLDLTGLPVVRLIGLHRALDSFCRAIDAFVDEEAFYTVDEKGRRNGSTWNGEMVEVIRAWADASANQLFEAISDFEPEKGYDAHLRSMFLLKIEAECLTEVSDIVTIVSNAAAAQLEFGDETSTAAQVLVEFSNLDEADQEQLLATAREMVARKKAA